MSEKTKCKGCSKLYNTRRLDNDFLCNNCRKKYYNIIRVKGEEE